ncbi:MAG: NAD(P)H-hydrate dehydratase [Oscillospiraceae bacterium]|nr:NAD(P)H-hydrate dehydratase [Oscillospiraceae bacterium]
MKILTFDQIKLIKNLVLEKNQDQDIFIKKSGEAVANIINKKIDLKNKTCVIILGEETGAKIGYYLAKKLYDSYIDLEIKIIFISSILNIKNKDILDLEDLELKLKKMGIKIYNTDNINNIDYLIKTTDILVDSIYKLDLDISDELKALSILYNNSKAIKFAIDIPTGIDIDSAQVNKFCFKATYTISFISLRPAHVLAGSREFCGKIIIADIGISQDIINKVESDYFLIDEKMIWKDIKIRKLDSHKGDYGRLINLSGSKNMRGAAALSTLGALRVGAGIVTLASIDSVITSVITNILEAKTLKLSESIYGTISINSINDIMSEINQSTACLIGCGLGVNSETIRLVKHIIKEATCPLVIDADGINIISQDIKILKQKKSKIILTPHLGEMSKLTNLSVSEIINSRLEVITEFAKEYNLTIVLKDYNTIVIDEKSKIYINTIGNPGLAKGGSGDILSGMIAGLLVQNIENPAVCGVYLHSRAAERCSKRKSKYSMLPSDIFEDLCDIFLEAGR